MKTREMADDVVMKFMRQTLKEHHKELHEAKVNIEILFVEGEEGAPSVKEGGYDTFGRVKFYGEDDRKRGCPDALLIIDHSIWKDADGERAAMIDHLLQRIEVRKDDDGEIIRDSVGRPKLNKRKFDMRLNGFSEVVERNGSFAPEYQAAREIKDKYGNLLMWAESPAEVG